MNKGYSIYEIDRDGERRHILSSPTMKEAEWAFDELRKALPKYRHAKIEWLPKFFADEEAIGEII